MRRRLSILVAAVVGCGGTVKETQPCSEAPPVTFSPCPAAHADALAPVLDDLAGPSCVTLGSSGAYHLVFHDDDDNVVVVHVDGPAYRHPVDFPVDPPAKTFDGTLHLAPSELAGDYATRVSVVDEAGHASAERCATISVLR